MKNIQIILISIFSLTMSGCFQSNPSDVVVSFIDAVENKKYDEARSLSTPETAKLINLQESISNFSKDSSAYVDAQLEIIEEQINGDTAYVKFMGREDDMPSTIKLVKTNGEWLVHITKEDITMKAGVADEGEEEGFYEEDDYTDVVGDSLDEMIPDSTTVKVE